MKKTLFCLFVIPALFTTCRKKSEPLVPPYIRMTLQSDQFRDLDSIPERYSCKGPAGNFPGVNWSNHTKPMESYVLIMDDPDAVAVVGYVYNHWLVYDIPKTAKGFPGDSLNYGAFASAVRLGKNSANTNGYLGPCPPPGQTHTYNFILYGLDIITLGLPTGATSSEVRTAMKGHILDSSVLRGTFKR